MQSIALNIVTHLTRQLHDRVVNFEDKLERTLVPDYSTQSLAATNLGWLRAPEKIAQFEANLATSVSNNVPSARRMFNRDHENVQKFGNIDPVSTVTGCLNKLFDIANLPHSEHPLFSICVANTYQWATGIADHWPEIRKVPEIASAVQKRAEQFMSNVLEHPGTVDRMALLTLQAKFIAALRAPVAEVPKLEQVEAPLTLPQRILGEFSDWSRQIAFFTGASDDPSWLCQPARNRQPVGKR